MHLRTDTSSNSHYAKVPTISRSRNSFSVAKKHVTTMQFDYLYPIYTKFIYPGDTLSITQGLLARLQTQGWILYDDLMFDIHAWFTPFRLIQTDWARYQFNAQPLGPTQDNSSLTSPSIDLVTLGASGFASKSLYDYFGYPTLIDLTTSGEHINNYLARAYNLIWNENYRDENLQTALVVDLDNGPDLASDYTLRKRGKRHDKLTSSLTAAQKGPAVTLPLGTTAPITGIGVLSSENTPSGSTGNFKETNQTSPSYTDPWSTSDAIGFKSINVSGTYYPAIYADLLSASSATLNQVRQSYAVQHLLEADARGGTRDVEAIQHRWGVTVPDFRLQRPEYLGGSTFTFDGHVVPQTSETGTTPQGNLTQFSQTMSAFNVNHSFVEHGVFMILISARSNITYQQGLRRELSYKTRFDWYQPEFSNLGEVAIKNKEIYLQGSATPDNATFGFQEYAYELRYDDNIVTSEMRSNYAQSLDMKHMADDYSTLPTLASAWIQSNTPIGRNIVVQPDVADPIEINMLTSGRISRTLPMYSIPGLTRL